MRRVDDDQAAQPMGLLGGEVPGDRAAPIVGHQGFDLPAELVDQRGDVGHEVLGAVGLHLGRGRRFRVAAQVRRDATVAIGEVFEQRRPRRTRPPESRAGRAAPACQTNRSGDNSGGCRREARRCATRPLRNLPLRRVALATLRGVGVCGRLGVLVDALVEKERHIGNSRLAERRKRRQGKVGLVGRRLLRRPASPAATALSLLAPIQLVDLGQTARAA